MKALNCLYIAVEKDIADDINAKVRAYINELSQIKFTELRQTVAALKKP